MRLESLVSLIAGQLKLASSTPSETSTVPQISTNKNATHVQNKNIIHSSGLLATVFAQHINTPPTLNVIAEYGSRFDPGFD